MCSRINNHADYNILQSYYEKTIYTLFIINKKNAIIFFGKSVKLW